MAFFDAGGEIIAAPAMVLAGANATTRTMRISAPQGCMAVSVFVGKFDGAGGHVEVRPGCQRCRCNMLKRPGLWYTRLSLPA